jgi:hypothetical protein
MATKKQSTKKRAATPVAQEPPLSMQPSETMISELAHRLFLERGGVHGHDVEDWLEAERLIRNGHA